MEIKPWFLLLLIKESTGKRSNSCITDDGKDNPKSSFVISCGTDHVIYNPIVTSGIGPCGHPICVGQSPDLMVDIRQCNWKNTCVLELPRRPMISENDCIAKHVDFLKLHQWKCVPDTKRKHDPLLMDICQNGEDYISQSGVIRSHFNFPWLYKKDLFDNGICNVSLLIQQQKKLILSVNNFSISEETDRVWIKNHQTGEEINMIDCTPPSNRCIFHFSTAYGISVFFEGNQYESKGDSGFVICYKMVKLSDPVSNVNVCDDVMKNPDIRKCSTTIVDGEMEKKSLRKLRRCRINKKKKLKGPRKEKDGTRRRNKQKKKKNN